MKEKNKSKSIDEVEVKNENKSTGFFSETIKTIILAILIVAPIKIFVMQPFFVQGASMQPNFHDGDYLIVKELGYKTTVIAAGNKKILTVKPFKDLKRQQIIVFRNPRNLKQYFIKRVIGLPGEKIVIANGQIKIYNKKHPEGFTLDESAYLPPNIKTGHGRTFQLKNDEYVVLGDNRVNSSDSRYWGPLKAGLIIGKVSLRAWPLSSFKIY